MIRNQSGFTTAALGFIVFGLLMAFIVVSRNISVTSESSSPQLSQETSPVASSTAKASMSPTASIASSQKPSNTASPSVKPNPSASTSQDKNSSPTPSERFVKITSPNGGESYAVGSTLHITWEYNDLAQCVIKYVTENNVESSFFIAVDPDQKSKDIAILENYLGPLDSAKIKIAIDCYSSDNNYKGDTSDGFITIHR